jgi:hypothetical protein
MFGVWLNGQCPESTSLYSVTAVSHDLSAVEDYGWIGCRWYESCVHNLLKPTCGGTQPMTTPLPRHGSFGKGAGNIIPSRSESYQTHNIFFHPRHHFTLFNSDIKEEVLPRLR